MNIRMKLNGAFGGSLRVWWVTHRSDLRSVCLLMVLVGLYVVAGYYDEKDRRALATRAEAAERALHAARAFAHTVPPVAFLLDARSPAQLEERMTEVQNYLDTVRYGQLRGLRPAK